LNLSVKTIGGYRERLKIKVGVDTARELSKRAPGFFDAP
jgi:DNA-binding CsgD family transcriptional regulator